MPTISLEIRRKCKVCGKVFLAKILDSHHCSDKCRKIAYKRKIDAEKKEKRLEQIASQVPEIREYISVKETVAIFGVERDSVYRLVRRGKVRSVNLGQRLIRINRKDLESLLPTRKKLRKEREKPMPKLYSLEPKDCYTITEICKKYRINDSEKPTAPPSFPPFPKQQPSGSQPVNLCVLKDEIRNMAVQALLDAEKQIRTQKESERLASGKLSAEQWVENNAERMVSLTEWCRDYSEQYNRIINQYNDSMMQAFKMCKAITEINGKIADKVSSLDSTLKPLVPVAQDALKNSEMTHWRLFRRSFLRCKSKPCWKNPYTYMYIFFGFLFSIVFSLSVYRNSKLRKMNAELLHENQVHRNVDVFMEPYATYRKERTMIQMCIESNGLKYTWDTVLEMRAKVDFLEAAK